MHSEPQLMPQLAAATARSPAGAVVCIALVLVAVFGIYWPTALEMVRIWWRSETFNHGFLVIPAFLWFVWRRRAALAELPVRPFFPALVGLAALGLVWLLGELSGSLSPSMFAMVAMVPVVIALCLGLAWVRALLFPLAFLFFAVPFGEVFVPWLMERTADFTVLAVRASGVPVYREGQYLTLPTGYWSVVEACSGIRYVIASVFTGVLYAWIMYRSPLRRALFVGVSLVVPIVANWVRAYGIVMLGHLSNNRIATGVDHIIYGWIFFGFVMFVVFWIGARWGEATEKAEKVAAAVAQPPASKAGVAAALALALLALAAVPLADASLAQAGDKRALNIAAIEARNGWVEVDRAVADYKPELSGQADQRVQTFEKGGRRVSVDLAYFRNQHQGAELVTSTNQIVSSRNHQWQLPQIRKVRIQFADRELRVNEARINSTRQTLVAWQWYWLGDISTTSDARAKFDLAIDRLFLRGDTSAWVTVFMEQDDRSSGAAATLAEFMHDMGDALAAALQTTAAR